ncbi:MAG: DUF4392 domain-containing protein [Planctomycetaceae bacterium]|nr:DUF4392 domain-containing protein [Planctomycetaceae bacterium]MBT6154074.1 DUF4392 domain-containing protein [Planctomycetaceae bacterium]MBT6485130.1 DUF4392 domain-containing protein [Planctomycetaceae bacterium]MBT6495943.1 DUF4392 domain-containing protein [Planctomycetaceae bacterium]
MPKQIIEQFERLIRRDPANRGLIAGEEVHGPLCAGHLTEAAFHLAEHATHVVLLTGFYVPHGQPPAAETDGPPGTLMLARALESLGVEVTVLTDELCFPAVQAAATATGFDAESLVVFPHESHSWLPDFFEIGRGRSLTHLISVERPGPSHTLESLPQQRRTAEPPLDHFSGLVPAASQNRCHNMRGRPIDEHTAETYRLFDQLLKYRPDAKTIGIGDGGNEIGMGAIPWEELHRRLDGEQAARIPCRIATDWTIVAGVSNWGAYALAAAVLLARNDVEFLRDWDADRELSIITQIVKHGPAVDGITARAEPTVDGLPFETYIQPWSGIRRLLRFE